MRWIIVLMLGAVLAGCSGSAADLNAVQAGPATAVPPGSPNWALAAPREVNTAAAPTHEVPIFATGPEELLAYLDAVALSEDRVEVADPTWPATGPARVYVQRSATFGFPDVISVEAIDLGTGDAGQRASLVVYSQAVYGHSDLGVNGARVTRWLARLAETAPLVSGRGPGA